MALTSERRLEIVLPRLLSFLVGWGRGECVSLLKEDLLADLALCPRVEQCARRLYPLPERECPSPTLHPRPPGRLPTLLVLSFILLSNRVSAECQLS